MAKAFDASKFRKSITKSVPGMSMGFRDPDTWISTGNYCLNKLISNDFHKGIPLGKVTVLAGESGARSSRILHQWKYRKKCPGSGHLCSSY